MKRRAMELKSPGIKHWLPFQVLGSSTVNWGNSFFFIKLLRFKWANISPDLDAHDILKCILAVAIILIEMGLIFSARCFNTKGAMVM